MFAIDADITDLKVKQRNLVKALFSMNNHQVATPEMQPEDARTYILFFRETGGKVSAFIGIYFLLSGRKLFYAHDSNPFPMDMMSAVEEEALGFAEELGAMLDQVDLSTMSEQEKQNWIDAQDIFAQKPITPAPQEAPVKDQAAPVAGAAVTPVAPPAPARPSAGETPQEKPAAAAEVPLTKIPAPPVPKEKPAGQQPSAGTDVAAAGGEATARDVKKPVEKTETPPSPEIVRRQEILDQAIQAGIVKSSKPVTKKEPRSATGVVGRDKEALARLLTSF